MTNQLYTLDSRGDYSCFIEKYDHIDNSFWSKYYNWQHIDLSTYETVKMELFRSEIRTKNFKMDISFSSTKPIILSEKATIILKDIIETTGQLYPVDVGSKRKKFFGFYPNKNVYSLDIVDLEKSVYKELKLVKGKIFEKLVLKNNYPRDDFLFTIEDVTTKVFVTEKFKKLIESTDLKAFVFKPFTNILE